MSVTVLYLGGGRFFPDTVYIGKNIGKYKEYWKKCKSQIWGGLDIIHSSIEVSSEVSK